jgi:hypothetical protein
MQEATSREEEGHLPWVEEEQRAHAGVQWEVDLEREEETG